MTDDDAIRDFRAQLTALTDQAQSAICEPDVLERFNALDTEMLEVYAALCDRGMDPVMVLGTIAGHITVVLHQAASQAAF